MTPPWPVVLTGSGLRLRELTRRDARAWYDLRRRNAEWLRPWEATLPMADSSVPATFRGMVRTYRREGRAGRTYAFGMEYGGRLVGQITLGGVAWGSLRSGHIGYWISQEVAGRGLMPKGVALVTDHAFDTLRLHRLEINIRPENVSSMRVAEKLGYRREGQRRQYLHIDGDWRDHISYVMLAQDRPAGGLLHCVETHGWRDAEPDESVADADDTGESVPKFGPPRP